MAYQNSNGDWIDDAGRNHGSDELYAKSYGDSTNPNKGGGSGKAMGGMATAFLGIFIILPIIVSWIVGLLWGLLLKLGIVGRILTTALMLIAGPLILLVPIFFAANAQDALKVTVANPGLAAITDAMLITAFMTIPTVWYFFWHYDAVKLMGARNFARKIKTFACFVWFGGIIGMIFGAIGNKGLGGGICYVSAIAGIIFYLLSTREYASEAAKNPSIKFPVIVKIISMAIAVGLIPVAGVISGVIYKATEARVASIKAESKAESVKYATQFTKGMTVIITKSFHLYEPENGGYAGNYGTPIVDVPTREMGEFNVIKNAKEGDILTVTGEAVQERTGSMYVPIEGDGIRGWIEADCIAPKE